MNMFSHRAVATTSHKNVFTDGHLTCYYLEIPDILAKIQRYFREREIGTEDCLILECDNSLPSALVLLYLLENGYSFLLLPKESNAPPGSNASSFIPKFCRYRVITESLIGGGNAKDLRDIEHLFSLSENEDWSGYQINPESPQIYLRTSGSTGTPKIVVHSHIKLIENAKNCVHRLGINSEDRIAIPVPIFHMYGLGAAFLPSILAGAAIDLQPNSNPIKYIQREREFNPNIAFTTPSFCDTLLKVRRVARQYKFTVVAGDRLKVKTFHQYESLCGCLLPLYGSTEMGAIAAASPEDPRELRIKTAGKPMSGVKLRVKTQSTETMESGQELVGAGEIWCQHEFGFERYIDENGNPVIQEESTQTECFRTKDWGRIGEEGYVEILGRCDHSVNRDGLLVFFEDVEKAMATIPGVETVAIVARGETLRGKGIIAYCTLTPGKSLNQEEIQTACFEILPRRAIPDRICILEALPLLPSGKVDRQKLVDTATSVNKNK